ncbi:MAG TPA: MBL fold metallo-hydrolase [Trebonia sp.]|jgi:glyoxylase-like metal-dependent hydrolase (beta-lactamase superfamily II)|nr:MBL fold metallo-hydrolase [Trebonia sp.]
MEEPLSTTGAEYVEPSADTPLKPGQRVARLFPRSVMGDYVLQRVAARTYWFSRHFYGTLFYVGERGVLLFDPIMGAADSLLAAIASVTPLPVTAVCYSHFHADHIGGARRLVRLLDKPPRVIASEHTAVWMERFGSDLPLPTVVLAWPYDAVEFEGVTLRLCGLPRPGHSPDHCVFLLAEERVGHSADLINIDQLPFGGFAGQDPLVLFKPNLEFARGLDFDWFSGGHGNIGEKSDFDFYIRYLDELTQLISEEIPRPESVPDLWLTDYLDGLDMAARERLLAELDNHFSLYLYGRQIARGEKPGRAAAGPGAFMSGLVGEWAAQRRQAVEEATPRILERLRPKYGRMYNFDDAQPVNIRLLAMSMQPGLENR